MPYPPFHPSTSGQPPSAMSAGEFAAAFPRETEFVEFKQGASQGAIESAAVAFSNSDGGVLLIGVDDAGRVVGKALTQGVEETIHQALRVASTPGRYQVRQLLVDGTPLVIVGVSRRVEGFAQTADGRTLVRRGPANVALFGSDLFTFAAARSRERYESTDSGVALSEAPGELIDAVVEVFGWKDRTAVNTRLMEQGLVVRGSSPPHLTVAGALYLLRDASRLLGKCFIEILRYPEGSKNYDKRLRLTGPLQRQVQEATTVVAAELGSEMVILGLRRHELPRIPEIVIREAVANAVAHRSYQEGGTPIRIEIRRDALKVISPGPLPEPVTEENIRDAEAARNVDVIDLLRRFRLAEDAGRGIDVMQDEMTGALLDPPDFRDTGHAVEVTLPIRGSVAPRERAWLIEVEDRGVIEPRDRLVLVAAAREGALTNSRVRDLLSVDSVEARRALQRLRDRGFLSQSGTRAGATYRLAASLQPPAGLRLTRHQLEDLVLQLAQATAITNTTVRTHTGLERIDALRLLEGLVQGGRLVRSGERRGTRYSAPASLEGSGWEGDIDLMRRDRVSRSHRGQ